jgi:molecular chaperone HscB
VAEDETAKVQDPELLMTVMEVREAVEEAQEESELCELKAENDERIEVSEQRIADGFERADLEGVKEETIRLRYWINVKESLDHWEKGKGVILEH